MGDPERPEAARPEKGEVNVAVASSSTPGSRPDFRLLRVSRRSAVE